MKSVEDYMKLPYTIEMRKDDDETYLVSVKELKGCMSEGENPTEAYEMIEDAMRNWIGFRLEKELSIPEPVEEDEKSFSGRFVVRITPDLHKLIANQAKTSRVSLNHYVSEVLAKRCSIIEENNKIIDSMLLSFGKQLTRAISYGAGLIERPKKQISNI